ncbi:MAG TPA: SIMPL domain-containing protein [Nevskiaceae bacterium]|nr:SIMPL domain-containing protein [Nevskiaceae bacterium]
MDTTSTPTANKSKLNVSLDLRIIVLVLLAVIVAMLFIWKPWASTPANARTVEVTGEAKLTDKPDEFVFYPSYQFKNTDKSAALAELTKKSDEVVAKLKALGVADSKIKTNSSGFDYRVYAEDSSNEATYTLQLTVTVGTTALTQKVQDYLVTTSPSGAVSPQASFSDSKRKNLESTARNLATKDARKKADQMAANLGFKVGKVKSVSDSQGFNTLPFAAGRGTSAAVADTKTESLTVQPGENDLDYSVTVEYFIH